jgi:hypothetical protein
MEILIEESKIHKRPAAIQRVDELGINIKQIELKTAPIKK